MTTIVVSRRALLASSALLAFVPARAFGAAPVYRDARAPIADRVKDLLSRMTLEEKVAQMRCVWTEKGKILDAQGNFSPDKAAQAFPDGIGQIGRPADTFGTRRFPAQWFREPEETAPLVNAMQRYFVERTRLGIPLLVHEETAHGYQARGATIFPIPPALGSTWDPALVERVFAVVGKEARVRGVTVALSPVIDLMREPRWGRMEEFFGEDPYLVGAMGAASVRGQQGPRPLGRDKVFVTLKHFVHGSPQGGLNKAPADMSERTLRETYLVPFAHVIRDADPAIVMPSYNEVEGVPAHGSKALLEKTGRGRLGFKGAYFSDYGGIEELAKSHHVAADLDAAAILALEAGVDADLPDGNAYARLPALVKAGRVDVARIDAAVARILALKFEAGLFENPYVDAARVKRETNTPAAIALARTVAEKALILLKNDGILPFDPAAKMKLAVIGPNAVEAMIGGYSGENDRKVGVLAGIRAVAGPGIAIEQADGVWISQPDAKGEHPMMAYMKPVPDAENRARIAQAVEVAKRSDTILLVLGDNPQITRESVAGPGDRHSIDLYGLQNELVEALLATGKPVVALLLNGRPLTVNRLAEKADALLEGWYLGEEGGHAVANVLFGRVNPGGKLTVSVPRSTGDLPIFYNHHASAEGSYLEGKRTPLFPFGHGLSYTSFDLSAPRLSRTEIGRGDDVSIEVDVTNTGKRAGDEVIQLYIRDDVSSAPRPVLELRRFERVTLKPGERRTVRFALTPDDLAFWNIDLDWVVEPGSFTISAGASSASLKTATLIVRA
ncbi:glycoside hydrolase family 3 C-terminal domain-containing protein [Sphingomonas sp. RP10(2022)]|uniref:beta-glucosidase n=1 Tax=Sphingomonas liriopis TaxID=2949094 RepID=A0A9X2HU51_9SPHN|nr:glycoside hydrolase family 3 N-terminal domain-containing protein [Sphingomonas liriopis]MCP3733533.1 glycoside hydrolase family 3 C-terminal domain-containing protein [Sphingomonas liriopis]